MNKCSLSLLSFAILGTSFATTAANKLCDENGLTNKQKEHIIAFVKRAQAHIELKGLKQASSSFMDPRSSFITNRLYIFVINDKQYALANGGRPELRGKNLKIIPYTHESAEKIYNVANQGGGWVNYFWMNPKAHVLQCKSSWVTRFYKEKNGQRYTLGAGMLHE